MDRGKHAARAAALLASPRSPVGWRAQLIHANDWQTGLAPAYAALADDGATPSIITIHNLAFQGVFAPHWVADLGLPAASFAVDGVEYYGRISFLKAGLFYTDAITTVSPTYAEEIQHEALGMGMHGLLAARRDRLTGILNGIDTTVWDPAGDPLIAARYDATTLRRKNANKKAMQIRFGLETQKDTLLLGAVTRRTTQKGIDLLLDIVDAVLRLPAQIVIQMTHGVADETLRVGKNTVGMGIIGRPTEALGAVVFCQERADSVVLKRRPHLALE